MAIPAQRFQSIAADFNMPIVDFQSLTVNDILNAPQVVFNDLMETATDLVSQIKEVGQDALSTVKSIIDDATRLTQNIYDAFTDLASFPQTMVGNLIDGMFPNSSASVKNLLKNMTAVCRDKAIGRSIGFGNKLKNIKCSGLHIGSPKCAPETAADLINQATLGALGAIQKSLNNLLRQIVGLGNLGFGANLCGVFAAITQGITDKSILTSAAGFLLNQQGTMGNLQAVFDISKNLNDLPIIGSFPGTIRNIAENLSVPFGNFQNDVFGLSDQVTGALGAIDDGWDMAEDGMSSISSLGSYNENLGGMFGSSSSNMSLDMDNLDSVQAPENSAFNSTYALSNESDESASPFSFGNRSYSSPEEMRPPGYIPNSGYTSSP